MNDKETLVEEQQLINERRRENWQIEVERKGEFTFRHNLGVDDNISILISSSDYTESAAYISIRELAKLLHKHDSNYATAITL